jgi:DNA-binding transcriptional MerR regulator
MLTVTQLARRCGVSRTTVLYYESIALLRPASRSASNYREYSEKELQRLQLICGYRNSGLKLEDVRSILDDEKRGAAAVLKRRLIELEREIEALREHQRSILKLLKADESLWRTEVVTKEKWIAIMHAAGFTQDDMNRWHVQFEKNAPEEHQEFLEFLHIPQDEIAKIRELSRKGK